MKKFFILAAIVALSSLFNIAPIFDDGQVFASSSCDELEDKESGKTCVETSGLFTTESASDGTPCACEGGDSDESTIFEILNFAVGALSIGVGVLGVIGIVWAGIMYLTAGGDTNKVQKAKTRILEIVIGLAIYVALYLLLKWLLPGFAGTT